MNNQQIISRMCISARAFGIKKDEWLRVEDKLSIMLDASGPEFVLEYMKDLREAKLDQMNGLDFSDHLAWHKVNRKGEPCDWQAILWNRRRPSTSVKIISSIINSIELHDDLSSKQFDKWLGGVRCQENPNKDLIKKLPKCPLDTPNINLKLAKLIANQEVFQPSDITGTSIPLWSDVIHVPGQVNDQDDLFTYLDAYEGSLSSAPTFSTVFDKRAIEMVEEQYPCLNIKDKEARLALGEVLHDNALARGLNDEPFDRRFVSPRLEAMDRVGQIAFLQQPGGKLRAIGNPNRYVQHLFRPLQKALSDFVNNQPGCYVSNQQEGMLWIQDQLRNKHKLSSMDLSAATDTLDYLNFIREVVRPKEGSLVEDQLETFALAAKSLWFCPALNQSINWERGQVLGLAPSFSLMTVMNMYACTCAQLMYEKKNSISFNGPAFAVVGDDAVVRSEIAPYYNRIISILGGNANLEKAMVSERYAEFCSHIISKDSIWPLKPKIRGEMESFFVDVEKTGTSRLLGARPYPKSFGSMAEYLSTWTSSDIGNLPSIPGNPRPLNHRLMVSDYMSFVSQISDRLPDDHKVDLGPIFGLPELMKVAESYPDIQSDDMIRDIESMHLIQDWLMQSPVKVSFPLEKKIWDWKKSDYVPKVNSITSARTLSRNLRRIEKMSDFSDNGLVRGFYDKYQSPTDSVQSEYRLLVDPKDSSMVLYQNVNGKDIEIMSPSDLESLSSRVSVLTDKREEFCHTFLSKKGLSESQIEDITKVIGTSDASLVMMSLNPVLRGEEKPSDFFIPKDVLDLIDIHDLRRRRVNRASEVESVMNDHSSDSSQEMSLTGHQLDSIDYQQAQVRLYHPRGDKPLPASSDDLIESLQSNPVPSSDPCQDQYLGSSTESKSHSTDAMWKLRLFQIEHPELFEDSETSVSHNRDDFDLDL